MSTLPAVHRNVIFFKEHHALSPSPIRTVLQSCHVSNTFSSSMTLEMNSLGVQSIKCPIVSGVVPPLTIGNSRTWSHMTSTTSGPHSEFLKGSLSRFVLLSK